MDKSRVLQKEVGMDRKDTYLAAGTVPRSSIEPIRQQGSNVPAF